MKTDSPKLGKYVKLLDSGEILELSNYDRITEMVELVSPDGKTSIVRRSDVDAITPDEQLELERSLLKSNKSD